MVTPITQQAADASINDSNKPRRSTRRRANMSLRGPAGPTTQRGKQKSRQNATKHGKGYRSPYAPVVASQKLFWALSRYFQCLRVFVGRK